MSYYYDYDYDNDDYDDDYYNYYSVQMEQAPMKTDVTAVTRGAWDVLEIVGVHEQLDDNSQRDDITV